MKPQNGHEIWVVEDGDSFNQASNENGIYRNGNRGVFDTNQPHSQTRRGRVQARGQVSPTLTSCNNSVCQLTKGEEMYRIRKLSPRECFRLMGFSDEDYIQAEEVNSKTQLYKQAGNSIVENVLVAIFGQMIEGKEEIYKTISRNEDGSRGEYSLCPKGSQKANEE